MGVGVWGGGGWRERERGYFTFMCGVVWRGVVWCGVVWCGVVWCGVVWCGVWVNVDVDVDAVGIHLSMI